MQSLQVMLCSAQYIFGHIWSFMAIWYGEVSRVAKCHGYSNCIHEGYDDEVDDDDINDVDHSIGTRVERECPQAAAVIHSQMKEAACSMTMMLMVMMMMMEMIIQLG